MTSWVDDDGMVTPRIRGVMYEAGTVFGRGQRPTSRHLDERVMRQELTVMRDELHATHVRVVASDPACLETVGAAVVEAGLGLWYSPAVFDFRLRPGENHPTFNCDGWPGQFSQASSSA